MMCFVGEHHWETVTDAGGALTTCARCGKVRSTLRIDDAKQEARQKWEDEGIDSGGGLGSGVS